MKPLEQINGLLLGTAVGDSIGLPAEGLSREAIDKLGWRNNWRQRLFFGYGLCSDDTEHTLMVARSLASHPQSVVDFQHDLAWRFRFWVLRLPAGVGFATLRAVIKLWLGYSPRKSGVYSAGNGAAMRSAVIGAFYSEHVRMLTETVRASTEMTHTDPRALVGALAIAHCAAFEMTYSNQVPEHRDELFSRLLTLSDYENKDWPSLLETIEIFLVKGRSVDDFSQELGITSVSGYVYHTVPVAIFAWLRHYGNFRDTITSVCNQGGDTDTVGAIAGAIAGTTVGSNGIPDQWLSALKEWPDTKSSMSKCATLLFKREKSRSSLLRSLGVLLRNIFFLMIVLTHGFMRFIPLNLRKKLR